MKELANSELSLESHGRFIEAEHSTDPDVLRLAKRFQCETSHDLMMHNFVEYKTARLGSLPWMDYIRREELTNEYTTHFQNPGCHDVTNMQYCPDMARPSATCFHHLHPGCMAMASPRTPSLTRGLATSSGGSLRRDWTKSGRETRWTRQEEMYLSQTLLNYSTYNFNFRLQN